MIEVKNVHKAFEDKILFDNYNLRINDGEFVIISGKSGCGKTTLLNMIGGIEMPDQGNILVDGMSVTDRKNRRSYYKNVVGFLFQNFALLENKTVRQNLEIIKKDGRTDVMIDDAIKRVGLIGAADKRVYKLSGGEQQRVALARLMIKKCSLILADEPTGSLDAENAEMVMDKLHELNNMGKTVIVVTHSKEIIKRGKRVVELR